MENHGESSNPKNEKEDELKGAETQDAAETEAQESEKEAVNPVEEKIAELEAKAKESENKYLYLYADFENYKKRAIKERSELLKYGSEPMVRELLQTVDNLERALNHIPEGTDKNLIAGLKMVLDSFQSTLKRFGIEPVESLEKDFDPNLHEAVGQEESSLPNGKVVREELGGYTLHGRLIRPARVIISGKSE